jgi:16S rRNA (cytosine1402-N4)-methyltransferase
MTPHTRRPRYPGRNPRTFEQKYKERNPDRYASEVRKVLAAGKTPAGMHIPIMMAEVLQCTRPQPGDIAVDCTLGGGAHAQAILERVQPGGRLIGMDVDPIELPRAEARMRAAGFGPDVFIAHHGNYAGLPSALAGSGLTHADIVLADLGVSSMQLDNPARGFSYKGIGPLDMRMNPTRDETAASLLVRLTESAVVQMLEENADEPHAAIIAALLKQHQPETTHAAERVIRTGLAAALPRLAKADIKNSVRRTFQALRIAVNDEFSALDALLRVLPACLSSGGRAVMITFHSGEDRRVKKAFQTGRREGVYEEIAHEVIRPSMEETRANRRASSAKLRWAVRA